MGFGVATRIDQQDLDIAGKFPQNLAAGPAGWRESVGIGRGGEPAEGARAFGNRLENGDALGADREAITGVLDVASGMEAAGRVFERRPDTEMGIRRVRVFAGGERGFKQSIVHGAGLSIRIASYNRASASFSYSDGRSRWKRISSEVKERSAVFISGVGRSGPARNRLPPATRNSDGKCARNPGRDVTGIEVREREALLQAQGFIQTFFGK